MLKLIIRTFIIALVSFLCVCWTLVGGNVSNAVWSEMCVFMFVTLWLLKINYKKLPDWETVLFAELGANISGLIVVIDQWSCTAKNLIFLIAMTLAILLAWMCYMYKKWVVYLIALIILIVFNTYFVSIWMSLMMGEKY